MLAGTGRPFELLWIGLWLVHLHGVVDTRNHPWRLMVHTTAIESQSKTSIPLLSGTGTSLAPAATILHGKSARQCGCRGQQCHFCPFLDWRVHDLGHVLVVVTVLGHLVLLWLWTPSLPMWVPEWPQAPSRPSGPTGPGVRAALSFEGSATNAELDGLKTKSGGSQQQIFC